VSAAAALDDDRDLVRPFRLAVLGVAIAFVLIGGLLAAYGSGADRPEGVAERWLNDVGDTRRDGVTERATTDVEKVGPLSLAASLLPKGSTDGRAAFIDLEVGKASGDAATTRVPFRLHQRIHGSAGPPIYGTVRMVKRAGDWHITALDPAVAGIEVPSEGGPPAAEAPIGLYLGALAVAALVTAFCVALVKAADPGEGDPAPAT
jgi:hypothetical protein